MLKWQYLSTGVCLWSLDAMAWNGGRGGWGGNHYGGNFHGRGGFNQMGGMGMGGMGMGMGGPGMGGHGMGPGMGGPGMGGPGMGGPGMGGPGMGGPGMGGPGMGGPRMGGMGFNNGAGPVGGVRPVAPIAAIKKSVTLQEVQNWLDKQSPFVLQTVMKHCTNLLINKHDVATEDLSDWYKVEEAPKKSGTLLEGGVEDDASTKAIRRDFTPGVGWTKSDMRHPYKVTHQMKPLPDLEIIPPFSAENKEADIDRDKRKMLTNNVNMMQIELNKICHRFKIKPSELDKENLQQYPEPAREKLSLAITCVSNAERTLNDFLDFLKNDKYKAWNHDQISKREALLKSMIGDTPVGKPHNSGIREEDIELVDAQFDKDGNIVASGGLPPGQAVIAGAPSGFAGIPEDEDDRTQDEKDHVDSDGDGSDDDGPRKKKKKKEVLFQKSSS